MKYLVILIALFCLSCKTRKVNKDLSVVETSLNQISHLQYQMDSLHKIVKQNNISRSQENQYLKEEFYPPAKPGDAPSLKSRETGSEKKTETDQSKITTETEVNKSQDKKEKLKASGEEKKKTNQTESDSTAAANIPWYAWLVGIIGSLILLAFLFKKT
jgi:cobalamin biosynthesis Mg chelatase CobN